MGKNLLFQALQACFAVFLFCSMIGCGVDVYVDNQTMDNINIRSSHVMKGEKAKLCTILPGNTNAYNIRRSYGAVAYLTITCPEDLDVSLIQQDTIVITEPQLNVMQARAGELTVSIENLISPTGEYGDMPAEDLLEDAEEEPAEDLMGES